jgi:hypothetical protein
MPALQTEGNRPYYQRPPGPGLGGFGQERGVRGRKSGHGGGLSADNGSLDTGPTIAAYAERFRDRARQGRIFSHGPTPLLDVVNRVAPIKQNGSRMIMEVGAGEGQHAALLAREPLSSVIAVEPNAHDTGINNLLAAHILGLRSKVRVVPADMFAVLGGIGRLANGSADTITVPRDDEMFAVLSGMSEGPVEHSGAVTIPRPDTLYSHSVAHLLDELGRRDLWEVSAAALPVGGILAASLKAEGDAQEARAEDLRQAPEGVYGQDPEHPAIRRLFVSNPGVIAQEMRDVGLELVCPPLTWSTPGYDFPGEDAQHVGFLAKKVA